MNVATRTDTGIRSLPAEFAARRGRGEGTRRLWQGQAGMHGFGVLGDEATDLAAMIQAGSQATLPIIAASNPGTLYQQGPNGAITVYAQPTGSVQNLPIGGGVYPTGVVGVNPVGAPTATLSGSISTGTMLMIATVGLLALFMMKR